ncbi:MAG: hypothetical protein GY898_18550 [Proteobacteria bacterium]|nr:hypothetical protein [Pseudomonadota bacterium]
MTPRFAAASLTLLLCSCGPPPIEPETDWMYVEIDGVAGPVTAVGELPDGDVLVATADGLIRLDSVGQVQTPVAGAGLPEGPVVWIGAGSLASYAYVHGGGIFLTADEGESFQPLADPPALPLPDLLNPRVGIWPTDTAVDGDGNVWLSAIGGLYVDRGDGAGFETVPVASSGSFNLLFTGVDVADDGVIWAVAQLADSMLPSSFQGLLTGTVFSSDDGGATWDAHSPPDVVAPTGVAAGSLGSAPCIATLDQGVLCRRGAAWLPWGENHDAVAVRERGTASATASQGVWTWAEDSEAWRRFGSGPVVGMSEWLAVFADGSVWQYTNDEVDGLGPEPADGTVHVALSFHANYYHSYRGDTPDDDGYGLDIDVIRTILGWLEEHPDARADWDIENHFTLDGWMASESPDIRDAIAARVAAGSDDVRVMSWNNGAVAGQTREEFDASISRALTSYEAVFDEVTAGVQPQENMFDPDHIGWYRALGIDWITLFYTSNGFNGMRLETDLAPADRYSGVRIRDPESTETMTWVPVYHHADVLDHGDLATWVRQISATVPGDSLLAIHFDADAESWENFGLELDRLQPLVEEGTAVFTNLEPYLAAHPPTTTIDVVGDLADGVGDGFQSWAEKDLNHEVWTDIVLARHLADAARIWSEGDADVEALLADALEARLIALSTTHFGLAAPFLHPDRMASARAAGDEAVARAQAALDAAVVLNPVGPTDIQLINTTEAAGPALIEVPLTVPADDWVGPEAVHLYLGAAPLPSLVEVIVIGGATVEVVVRTVVDLEPMSSLRLTWQHDTGLEPADGGLTTADLPADVPLTTPFTECAGVRTEAPLEALETHVDANGVVVSTVDYAELGLCDGVGSVAVIRQRWRGLDGTVLSVVGQLPEITDPTDAESVALSPLACPGTASTLSWDSHGGTHRTRPMRPGVDTWNANAARSYLTMGCSDGSTVDVSHRTTDRSSIAFAPIRERDGVATLAPLGTLWGTGPWHNGRSTGGSGLGEIATLLVGSQFRPAAPDWAGKTVQYCLLVGEGLERDALVLFAHPPVVVVGQ